MYDYDVKKLSNICYAQLKDMNHACLLAIKLAKHKEQKYELALRIKAINDVVRYKHKKDIITDRLNQVKEMGYVYSCLPPNWCPLILPLKKPKKDYSYITQSQLRRSIK